jgi:hypothetical protein
MCLAEIQFASYCGDLSAKHDSNEQSQNVHCSMTKERLLLAVFETIRDCACMFGEEDLLGHFRRGFCILNGTIYMNGNSPCLLSEETERSALRVSDEWRRMAAKEWQSYER